MSNLIVGLTGGIGSGKTTVSDLFANKGIEIIDADVIAREVVTPGQPALAQIIQRFGEEVIDNSGALDRKALRQIVFSDPDAKQWLNHLLHPLIRKRMLQACQQATSDYCILSVPLLVENQMTAMVDKVLVVDLPESVQLARASRRDDSDQQEIRRIMDAQASRAERLAVADDIIDNSGIPDALHKQVDTLHQYYSDLVLNN